MAITTPLDQKAAVIIDLQKGVVSYPTARPIDDVVKRASELAAAVRRHGLPFPRLGENGTTHEILDLLKKRFE
jgi:hypothetical protein